MNNTRIAIRFNEEEMELLEKLRELAKEDKRKLSSYIKIILEEYIRGD